MSDRFDPETLFQAMAEIERPARTHTRRARRDLWRPDPLAGTPPREPTPGRGGPDPIPG